MAEVGRPTVMTKEVLDKLEYAFSIGCTDKEACLYADINPATLYNYQQDHPEFVERKELLKENPILSARQTVVKALNDPDIAFRYLERKKKDEFSPRSEITGKDGSDLLPTPILANLDAIPNNNGDQENSPALKTDTSGTGRDQGQQDNLDTLDTHSPGPVGQDPDPDERSVGVSAAPEAGSGEGLHEDHEGAEVLEA